MKRILLFMIGLMASLQLPAVTPEHPILLRKDTVVINFGNNSKILILVDNPQELKKISEFDINSMLKDLSISVDSLPGNQHYLKIEDETGEKYLMDTSIVVNSSSEIDVDKLKQSIKEEVKQDLRDEYYNSRKKLKRNSYKRTRHYFNFEFGMNNYVQDGRFPDENNALYTVKPWGSWYVGFSGTNRTHIAGILFLDWGGGISWYNFKHQNFRTRLSKTNVETIYFEDMEISGPLKSKLSLTHLNLTLVPLLHFGKSGLKKDLFHWDYYDSGFRIGLGGYVGYRIKSWTKFTWREGGSKKKNHNRDNFFLNNVRYGARLVMGFKAFEIFVNYDISELYATDRGPKLNAFSFGIVL